MNPVKPAPEMATAQGKYVGYLNLLQYYCRCQQQVPTRLADYCHVSISIHVLHMLFQQVINWLDTIEPRLALIEQDAYKMTSQHN